MIVASDRNNYNFEIINLGVTQLPYDGVKKQYESAQSE